MLIKENKRWVHQSSLSHMINDGLTNNYLPHVYLLIHTSVVYCCRYFSQQWHNIAAWGHNKLLYLLLLSFLSTGLLKFMSIIWFYVICTHVYDLSWLLSLLMTVKADNHNHLGTYFHNWSWGWGGLRALKDWWEDWWQ